MEIAQTPQRSSTATAQPATRMTREQSKANTRERLLAAARRVFARSGFHGASVEEIASMAGFSTGALYSNFDGKEDLFLILMEREIDEHAREISKAVRERASVSERATGGARQWMTMIEREPDLLLLFMEFWAYGVRDAKIRPKVAAQFAHMREVLTKLIAESVREFDLELDLPPEQLAVAIDALADGIARQKLADPDAVPDELMGRVLSLLFAGATRPAAGRGRRSGR
ncbi:MAG: TetR family transcriptional regulator [Solirubrobacterales bacterium]|nr:TetR family transcriptional regulator [Solirubrobacterales bacterium]MCW3025827.1 TetR family transcriptional regulator [Solirubrobacterales bacterium]